MGAHSGIGKHAVHFSYLLVMIFALISSAATAQAPQVSPPAINVMPMPATVTLVAAAWWCHKLFLWRLPATTSRGWSAPRSGSCAT